jgi:hypothetical protein
MTDGPSVLGLGADEQAAYELLIDHPSATLDELHATWTLPVPLSNLLPRLEERALAVTDPGPPIRYRAVAPGVAFDALLLKHETELEHARRHMDVLDAAYQARTAVRDTATVIEVVTGTRAVSQRLLQLQSGARTQIAYLASFFDGLDPLHRGLTCRAIYDRSAIEHPGALATVERLINAGQLARVLPGLPLSLLIADDKVAALPVLRPPAPLDAILIVHPSALLDALTALFDALWQRALPLHPPAPRTNPVSQRLITLLLSGLTDEAIAHQLNLSHRTIQRRVATLMSDLAAHTRFQAGVQAALLRLRRPPT